MNKILIITLEYPPQLGGIASYAFNVAKHLDPANFVVYALVCQGGTQFDSNYTWKVYRKKPYFFLIWPRWLKLLFQVWRICRKEKITHIHVHHVLPVGVAALIMKRVFKITYYLFLHGTDIEMATRNSIKKKEFEQICAGADKIFVNSEFLKNKLLSHLESQNMQIAVIYPCPGDQFFMPVPQTHLVKLRSELALSGRKIIITVARMNEGKGYPHLIRLMPSILEKIPNLAWVIIGDGPKKDEILGLIKNNGLQNVVRFIGNIPYKNLPLYYQLADFMVLLTHPDEFTEEGWGTVFMEAAACGLPVVAGRAGGVEEAVENMVTGIIVDVHQEQGAANAIIELLSHPDYAKQMGQAGRDRAMREFRWEKQIQKL